MMSLFDHAIDHRQQGRNATRRTGSPSSRAARGCSAIELANIVLKSPVSVDLIAFGRSTILVGRSSERAYSQDVEHCYLAGCAWGSRSTAPMKAAATSNSSVSMTWSPLASGDSEHSRLASHEPSATDLSSLLVEAVVVLASSNRSSNSRIRRVSSSGNLGSVDPIWGTGGAGSKPKTSEAIRMAFSREK